jgi:glycosyltransferase involved in cell wall biosynthesis
MDYESAKPELVKPESSKPKSVKPNSVQQESTSHNVDPKRPKLLLLLPFAPGATATHGGSRVLAQLVVRLAQNNRIAILYLRAAGEPLLDETVANCCEMVEEVERVDYERTFFRKWLLRFSFLVGFLVGRPMWVVQWSVPAYQQRLSGLLQEWQPDIVQAEFHVMGQYLLSLPHHTAALILTEHEPGIQAAPYLLGIYPKAAYLVHVFDRIAWYRYERRLLNQVDRVVVFTEEDRRTLRRYKSRTPIVRIPLGSELPEVPLDPLGQLPPSLIFVGNFNHGPNIDAAQRLLGSIYPQICCHIPDARLYIVGNLPPPQVRHAATERVIVTGFVPEVTPYLDRAAVVVVPLRLGGGMRVKVLEAMAAGKAIVASPTAIHGLSVVAGEHLLVAEDDDEFAEAVIKLLRDPVRRVMLGVAARSWAEENLGWGASVAEYEALYQELTPNLTSLLVNPLEQPTWQTLPS